MKIHLDIDVSSGQYNSSQMELLRLEIRKNLTPFLFKCAENTKTPMGHGMNHGLIDIDGTVKLVDFDSKKD